MGPNARTRIICDRFSAGHPNSALRWHLDSVPPETPIRDIVDRCRVWESHADTDDQRVVKPTLKRAQPVHEVSEPTLGPTEQIVAAITGPSVGLANLGTMLKCLLPAIPAQAPPPLSAATDLETMLKRLLPAVPAQALQPRSAPTEIEAMLKRLFPGTLTQAPQPRPAIARRDWAVVLCFSCGNYGHGASRCTTLDVKFPYMLPGWSAEKRGDHYAMISPRLTAERLRAGNGDWSGMEGQPPGSVIHSDPRTLAAVHFSPPPVLRCLHGLGLLRKIKTAGEPWWTYVLSASPGTCWTTGTSIGPSLVDTPKWHKVSGAKIRTRNTPPLVWQMTSDDDLSADEEVVADSSLLLWVWWLS